MSMNAPYAFWSKETRTLAAIPMGSASQVKTAGLVLPNPETRGEAMASHRFLSCSSAISIDTT